MNPSEKDALHTILSAVVDETASESQIAELTRILEQDPEARRFYIRYLDMHAALTGFRMPQASIRFRRLPWVAMIASLMAASALIVWLASARMESRRQNPSTDVVAHDGAAEEASPVGYVATITAATADAVLDGEPVREGMRLDAAPYWLMAGGVSIRFDGGARILLDGTSRFTIRSRRAIRIDEGTLVFQGDQTCESIEVITPHSTLRNIGTRYAAVIDGHSEELHVVEGAVRRKSAQQGDSAEHELVEAGTGRRYDAKNAGATPIQLDESLATRSLAVDSTAADDAGPTVTDGFRGVEEGGRIGGLVSGTGWVGPWESGRNSLRLVSPGLSGPESVAVLHDAVGESKADRKSAAHRKLETPIDLSQDGIWYLRFLVRRSPLSPGDDHRAMVVLRTRGLTAAEELERNSVIQIALRRHDSVLLRVEDSLVRASMPQRPDQTYAVVAKIVAGRAKPDQVLVSVLAAERLIGSSEPSEWSIVSEAVESDLRLDKLSLEYTSGGRIAVGDLCIGTTWSSIARSLEP